jgi:Zn-dependent M28 family amino/carboxypeptidase
MRALAAANPVRECLFVAFSGHETGFIGIDAYLASRPELMQRAHAWIHLGANFDAPRQPNELHTQDDYLDALASAALTKQGIAR